MHPDSRIGLLDTNPPYALLAVREIDLACSWQVHGNSLMRA
jgi:hypothetical protein